MSHPFALYNPALLPPEVLLSEYSARLPLLETLLGIVRSNQPGHPPQHCLLIGARGMGKTTTLWAVAHKINRDYELARQWQPVVFDEESRRVGDLADFWLEAIRQWEFATKATTDLTGPLLAQNPPDIEERAHRIFTELVARSGKRVVLLIDNLNDLLASIRDAEPLHRLRAALMQDSGIMLIGGATSHFEHVTSVDQPFYDFFRIFELKPLSLDEMRECLQSLAKSRGDADVEKALVERSGSIQALHILSGGNPRLIKTFYRLLREGLHTDIRADLEKLLDEFTPYFKAIVDALSGQQQRILDAVALAWNPVEVATLATATRLPPNHVSAQIRALMKLGILREAAGHPKKKTYLLTDRFSNIHYLMRHGRAARNRLDWFVATITTVFSEETSTKLLAQIVCSSAASGPNGIEEAKLVLESALNRIESVNERRRLISETISSAWKTPEFKSLSAWFNMDRAKQVVPEIEALGFFQHLPTEIRVNDDYEPNNPCWWVRMAEHLCDWKEWRLGEKALRKSIELDPTHIPAWHNLGNLLQDHLSRPFEAETVYHAVLRLNPGDAMAWNSIGTLYQNHFGNPSAAKAAYERSIAADPSLAASWHNLAVLLRDAFKQYDQSEVAYRRAIELEPRFAHPWNGLGVLQAVELSKPDEAEKSFRKAIEINPSMPDVWTNLGNLMIQLNRDSEAEVAYRRALEVDPTFPIPYPALSLIVLKRDREESGMFAETGLVLNPRYRFAQQVFLTLFSDIVIAWNSVIPQLIEWNMLHPHTHEAFDFTIDGLIRHAQLTKPAETLPFLSALPEPHPFESIQDALKACDDREHLHRLAPERQAVALELMRRIQEKPKKAK
ncbi:MAG: tetratricopeptide repeat protein [Verrucomicrobiaceae bacterium]|nr:tetratricopeptide repeat protein [Verrucomicrobiaceae bacterium]